MSRGSTADVLNALGAVALRPWIGVTTEPAAKKPEKPLVLYEFEGCLYCRMVREALTELDLEAMIYPCPPGGTRFRPKVAEMGGKAQFPYLVDPNTDTAMYESGAIVDYLYATYGGRAPHPTMTYLPKPVQIASAGAVSLARGKKGRRARPSKWPQEPLELWSFEASPYARPVRELLCELELPYLLHNVGRSTPQDWVLPPIRKRLFPDYEPELESRLKLKARAGSVSIPYFVDPNYGVEMCESKRILKHIEDTYAA